MSNVINAHAFEEMLLRHLTPINQTLERILSNQADVTTAIAAVQTAVNKLGTDLQAEIAAFKAALAAGQDTAPQVAALDNIATTLATLDASVVSATPSESAPAPAEAAPAATTATTTEAPATATA